MASHSEASFLRVEVWGMFLEGLAFGLYLVTCGPCFRLLFTTPSSQKSHSKNSWPLALMFLTFLAEATSSLAIHLYLNLQMVSARTQTEAVTEFRNSRPINMFKVVLTRCFDVDADADANALPQYTTILVQSIIFSGFLIYRCWRVYNRVWIYVILPSVLWLAAVVLMAVVVHFNTTHKIDGIFDTRQSRTLGSCFWAVEIAVNIITTGLLSYRLWRRGKLQWGLQSNADECIMSRLTPGKLASRIHCPNPVYQTEAYQAITRRIRIDSPFQLFVAHNNAVYASIDVLVHIVGIAFNLIIIHNHSHTVETASRAQLDNAPLRIISSNRTQSAPPSAIEFAYPKQFVPRRKNQLARPPAQEDNGLSRIHGNYLAQQSIHISDQSMNDTDGYPNHDRAIPYSTTVPNETALPSGTAGTQPAIPADASNLPKRNLCPVRTVAWQGIALTSAKNTTGPLGIDIRKFAIFSRSTKKLSDAFIRSNKFRPPLAQFIFSDQRSVPLSFFIGARLHYYNIQLIMHAVFKDNSDLKKTMHLGVFVKLVGNGPEYDDRSFIIDKLALMPPLPRALSDAAFAAANPPKEWFLYMGVRWEGFVFVGPDRMGFGVEKRNGAHEPLYRYYVREEQLAELAKIDTTEFKKLLDDSKRKSRGVCLVNEEMTFLVAFLKVRRSS
ncbi:hypothetical protein B0H16DRAFT_1463913 [Mycena metata]|uniref:Uncharacterized protein n=1 Tax=Mycena metata TaxID=1033252 RepID=A0AAD7N2H8_9AGAR|nr:hypothetical protein B0H16DRAFT_1463913 [Mycena metata]